MNHCFCWCFKSIKLKVWSTVRSTISFLTTPQWEYTKWKIFLRQWFFPTGTVNFAIRHCNKCPSCAVTAIMDIKSNFRERELGHHLMVEIFCGRTRVPRMSDRQTKTKEQWIEQQKLKHIFVLFLCTCAKNIHYVYAMLCSINICGKVLINNNCFYETKWTDGGKFLQTK